MLWASVLVLLALTYLYIRTNKQRRNKGCFILTKDFQGKQILYHNWLAASSVHLKRKSEREIPPYSFESKPNLSPVGHLFPVAEGGDSWVTCSPHWTCIRPSLHRLLTLHPYHVPAKEVLIHSTSHRNWGSEGCYLRQGNCSETSEQSKQKSWFALSSVWCQSPHPKHFNIVGFDFCDVRVCISGCFRVFRLPRKRLRLKSLKVDSSKPKSPVLHKTSSYSIC